MPYFWDKTPDTLPQPELNPLTNPVLERNLGRWAQAYFSNPPGEREQAISRLLQEIKSETSEILIAERAQRASSEMPVSREFAGTASAEGSLRDSRDVICSTCRHINPPGHRFCGQCGGGLYPSASEGRDTQAWRFDYRQPASGMPGEPLESQVEWLRDRSLTSMYEPEAPRRGWMYVVGGLTIALAVFAYMKWSANPSATPSIPAAVEVAKPASPVARPRSLPAADRVAPEVASARPQPSVSDLGPKPSQAQPPRAKSEGPESQDRNQPKMPTGVRSAPQTTVLLASPATAKPQQTLDGGNNDLRLAERYLGGSMGTRDSTEAAKLLWKAVRQQNPTAAMLLSQLYARGDGVPKSCDQARLLLVAALKHGLPQAAGQLRDLEARGCR